MTTPDLADAVARLHGCKAVLERQEPVLENFDGRTVWEGVVSVYRLEGHPTALLAYAWTVSKPDGGERVFAVLQAGPIESARDAVRAAILRDFQG